MDILKDLELLILSRYPIIAVETYEEERVGDALQQIAEKLSVPFFFWTVAEGLKRGSRGNEIYDTQHPVKALNNLAAMDGEGIYFFKDLHRYLSETEVIRRLQDVAHRFSKARRAVVLSAPHIDLPSELEKLAACVKFDLPSVEELKTLAKRVISDLSKQHTIRVELSSDDFDRLVERLTGLTFFEAERVLNRAVLDDLALTTKDFELVTEIKKELLRKEGILELVASAESLAQVGGLQNLKKWLEKRAKAFTPEARTFGLQPPKGIILLGVQGCGKSMAAKAVAKVWGLPLLKMEAGRIYDKYIGESDKNLERALSMAEHMAPCVLMIDEIEKGFAYVGSSESDAGLSRRIFGRLLGWLQDKKAPVFVVATCNQISQLPPELMRQGRFDEVFFIDLPSVQERKEIFSIHLRNRKRDPALFDLDKLAAASEGFTGAEIEQSVVSALYTAFSRSADVNTSVVLEELAATRPISVVRSEEIDALRQWAQGRTVMAS
jgi:SpoVK/Ycf46/Vps4 family AAA+-type ATPase